VKYFSIIVAILLLYGCASTQIKEPVFIKCQIPDVPKPELYPLDESKTYPEKLQSILNNYFLLQKEVEMLRKAQEVCK